MSETSGGGGDGDDDSKPSRRVVAREIADKLVAYEGKYADVDGYLRTVAPDLRVDGLAELLCYRFLHTGTDPAAPDDDPGTPSAGGDRRRLDTSAFDDGGRRDGVGGDGDASGHGDGGTANDADGADGHDGDASGHGDGGTANDADGADGHDGDASGHDDDDGANGADGHDDDANGADGHGNGDGDANGADSPARAAAEPGGTPVGVRDFLALLPERVETLDPAVSRETVRQRGRVEGRVDWRETIAYRARAGGDDGTVVAQVSTPGVASDRNRVLVRLLTRLRETAREAVDAFADTDGGTPPWLDGWERGGRYRETVAETLDADPHLSGLDPGRVDDRTVERVARDPDPLYAEAAALLGALRRIDGDVSDLDHERLTDLFLIDAFEPDAEDRHEGATVYELYWALQVIDQVPTEHLARFDTNGDQVLSRWHVDGTEYLLCHDTDGSVELDGVGDVELASFLDPRGWATPDRSAATPTTRRGVRRCAYADVAEASGLGTDVNDGEDPQPDIVVFALDRDPDRPDAERVLRGLFVGEVKHSTDDDYLQKGLDEVTEYAGFARVGADASLPQGVDGPAVGDPNSFGERVAFGLFVGIGDDELSRVGRGGDDADGDAGDDEDGDAGDGGDGEDSDGGGDEALSSVAADAVQVRGWGGEPEEPLEGVLR